MNIFRILQARGVGNIAVWLLIVVALVLFIGPLADGMRDLLRSVLQAISAQ